MIFNISCHLVQLKGPNLIFLFMIFGFDGEDKKDSPPKKKQQKQQQKKKQTVICFIFDGMKLLLLSASLVNVQSNIFIFFFDRVEIDSCPDKLCVRQHCCTPWIRRVSSS